MNKIEVAILNQSEDPAAMMMFLARLTQRGHEIHSMQDLQGMYHKCIDNVNYGNTKPETISSIAALPHGTIKRFSPITIAIVGASRRFLAQARTHQVGFNYVSASLQYSDYSGSADFVVPYSIIEQDYPINKSMREGIGEDKISPNDYNFDPLTKLYLNGCKASMAVYNELAQFTDNDTAGYAAPQGLRNILIMQANHEAWSYFIGLRACNRNTVETQYVTMKIWEALLASNNGQELFKYAGPNCCFGQCREGKMSCLAKGNTVIHSVPADDYMRVHNCSLPTAVIATKWPLLDWRNKNV